MACEGSSSDKDQGNSIPPCSAEPERSQVKPPRLVDRSIGRMTDRPVSHFERSILIEQDRVLNGSQEAA